jgi:hypothetical protein
VSNISRLNLYRVTVFTLRVDDKSDLLLGSGKKKRSCVSPSNLRAKRTISFSFVHIEVFANQSTHGFTGRYSVHSESGTKIRTLDFSHRRYHGTASSLMSSRWTLSNNFNDIVLNLWCGLSISLSGYS